MSYVFRVGDRVCLVSNPSREGTVTRSEGGNVTVSWDSGVSITHAYGSLIKI